MTVASHTDPLTSAYPLFDAARLSQLVGAEVCAGGLRHKPGRSTSASLVEPRTGRPSGWAQVLLGWQPEKVANARRRAAARGLGVHVRDLPDLHGVLLHGPVDTDPRLHRGLATIEAVVPDVAAAISSGAVDVLRYNALRRLVLRRVVSVGDQDGGDQGGGDDPADGQHGDAQSASEVVRVSAHRRGAGLRAVSELARRGIPVGAPVPHPVTPTSRYVTVWPWLPGTDVTHSADPAAVHAAAHALAEIHSVADSVGGHRLTAMVAPGRPPHEAVGRIVGDLLALAPDLTARVLPLLERLPEPAWSTAHIVHGDFSADQVISPDPVRAEVRIIDLDRIRLGDPHEDLGCFAAAELRRTAGWGLLPGLLDAYPRPVRRGSLHAWTLHALVLRLLEPFRNASPTWRRDILGRLDEIDRVRTQGVLS